MKSNPIFSLVLISQVFLLCFTLLAEPFRDPDIVSLPIEDLQILAENGHPYYQGVLSILYRTGDSGQPLSLSEAEKWALKSSKGGSAIGTISLGSLEMAKDNILRANEYYQEALQTRELFLLADDLDPIACYCLADLYMNSEPIDPSLAISYYQKAADLGYTNAQAKLGSLYLDGNRVPRDTMAGIVLLEEAATKGSAIAALKLGTAYADGNGVIRNNKIATRWLQQAMDQEIVINPNLSAKINSYKNKNKNVILERNGSVIPDSLVTQNLKPTETKTVNLNSKQNTNSTLQSEETKDLSYIDQLLDLDPENLEIMPLPESVNTQYSSIAKNSNKSVLYSLKKSDPPLIQKDEISQTSRPDNPANSALSPVANSAVSTSPSQYSSNRTIQKAPSIPTNPPPTLSDNIDNPQTTTNVEDKPLIEVVQIKLNSSDSKSFSNTKDSRAPLNIEDITQLEKLRFPKSLKQDSRLAEKQPISAKQNPDYKKEGLVSDASITVITNPEVIKRNRLLSLSKEIEKSSNLSLKNSDPNPDLNLKSDLKSSKVQVEKLPSLIKDTMQTVLIEEQIAKIEKPPVVKINSKSLKSIREKMNLPGLKNKAAKGNIQALLKLGDFYTYVVENPALAKNWYIKASYKGNSIAQRKVGRMYFRGSGLPQDYGLAYRYFLAAAKNGDVISQRYIAIMYYKGIGLSKDERQAIRWFSVASRNGDLASKKFLSPNG